MITHYRQHTTRTGVCEKTTPFACALAMRPSSRNCSPAPDLVLSERIFQPVFLSRGVFFHRHRHYLLDPCSSRTAKRACLSNTI